MKFTTLLLILSLFCTFSCHKSSTTGPTLSIAKPLADDQFSNGQPIRMTGEVGDSDGLHTMSITITDDKTKAVLYTESPNVLNLKTYGFDKSWVAKVSDWTDATVTIKAANHGGQETVKTVKIKVWL
jgi:hypothetical protein